ncbi:MAG: hypothetical protein HDR36_09890 [Treponema sp.]|nr:hypothetical protein [Treponema sp.]
MSERDGIGFCFSSVSISSVFSPLSEKSYFKAISLPLSAEEEFSFLGFSPAEFSVGGTWAEFPFEEFCRAPFPCGAGFLCGTFCAESEGAFCRWFCLDASF